MSAETQTTTGKMKGGIRRRGERGKWSYTIDLGLQPAQRCNACGKRTWLARRPLPECPSCGGTLRDTRERREQTAGGFETATDARKARNKARTALDQGTHIVRDRIALGEWLEHEWLPSLAIGKLRPTTRSSYASHVKHHLAPTKLGRIPMQEITREQIGAHYAWLLTDGRADGTKDDDGNLQPLSPATVRRVHATLHRALRDAVRSRLLTINPSDDIELPAADGAKRRLMAWDSGQLRTFLESIREDRLSALWLLYATTGARRGELLGLTWQDLDLEAARLTIRRAHVEVDGEIVESLPKTSSGARTIELDPATVAALKHHGTQQKQERLAAGPRWQDTEHVFVDQLGQPLQPGRVSHAFAALVKLTNLPRITLHGLRHTYITVALNELALPTSMVSKRVGHANEAITLVLYTEWLPRHDQQAALQVAGLVVPKGF
jgi:integrase